ncbi:phosphatidylglycerophosphatase [Nitrosomonas cryotolerans]|uniref:Phosphatidylglycerophosphatase A n=1 Tax=Nitrosomonas cryotolerans ATCC 49181 TaxID=1131553 RepID=A0A1N6GNU5_9PROT|nr:phosphatidylglycerophosphatase A [Nitrosomonas cryotolerans]SFP39260.1 phosphatidylglycerophosphatase [Nitrosomonas cryotolerans]SIO09193.1 phosphatidylglycerophosphatase [Nitrosomonas cryotolerans ATCC 49181]
MTTSIADTNPSKDKSSHPPADWNFVSSRFVHFIAFGGGLGLSSIAPGTIGTLAAFPLFWLCNYYLEPIGLLLLIDIMFIAGIWACGITGKVLGRQHHQGMVWGEIVAFLLVLLFTPDHWIWQAAAFALFRFFDIAKPQPIRYYDHKLKGGLGVMLDDLLAAFFTLLCLAAWKAMVLHEGYF